MAKLLAAAMKQGCRKKLWPTVVSFGVGCLNGVGSAKRRPENIPKVVSLWRLTDRGADRHVLGNI